MSSLAPPLAVTPKPRKYPGTAEGAQQLRAFLQAKDAAGPKSIKQADDLLLDEKTCKLGKRYRLTAAALSQLCSMLCPGFGQVVCDVAGIRRAGKSGEPGVYSTREAAKLFNAMVRFRGARLKGNELILDRRSRTVEGVVGPEYQFFSNMEFWNQVQEFLASSGVRTVFHGAIYRNRRLSIRYKFRQPAFTIATKLGKREPFYGGWHFSNSEVGDCAVHMAAILLRGWSSSVTLVHMPDIRKLVHRGARAGFYDKLGTSFETLSTKSGVPSTFKSQVEQLASIPLGLGGSPKSHEKKVKALKTRLARSKLGPRLANEIVQHVLFCGSYKADAVRRDSDTPASFAELQQATNTEVFEARTAFDLFNALGIRAKYEKPERQELAEQLAYKVLVGQFTL